jgi:hypothetical protein
VSVVTRSGTNRMHGTLYDFIRDDRFNAANALSGTTLPMDQQQYGGSLGGPVAARPDVLLRERRAARARSDGARHHPSAERGGHQREAERRRISGRSR